METWKRTHHAVWVANLATSVGMMSFLPFFPLHLERLGVTGTDALARWTGVVFGAAPLSAAVMSPVWGALGDRIGRRIMVLRSMLAITLFVGCMAFARGPWQLLALRVLQGVFSGFLAPSLTLVSIRAPAGMQGRIAGSMQVSVGLGAIAGPALGEFVRLHWGLGAVYLAVAALAALSALLVVLFAEADSVEQRRGRSDERTSLAQLVRHSLRDLRELCDHRGLRAASALVFWVQFGNGAGTPQLELFVRGLSQRLPWVHASTAALFSAPAAIALLAMPLWGRLGDRLGHFRTLTVCAGLSGVALALHGVVAAYEDLFAARLALGLAMAGVGPLAYGVAAAETATEQRGGAFGVVFAARSFAVAFSAMLGGELGAWLGLRSLYWGGGAAVLGAVALARRAREGTAAGGIDERGAAGL